MKKGKFIVFEGTDGSGKTTQMRMLGKYLEERGIPTFLTHEPTDSPFGSLLRACLSGRTDTDEYTIALMFAADRTDHVRNRENGILSRLEAGVTVLCDRYYFSSYAYNGGFVPLEYVIELNRPVRELLRPDLVLFLDTPVEEAMKRVSSRGETERYETLEKQRRIRDNYFAAFERFKEEENIVVVPCEEERAATQEKIRRLADDLFGGKA